jgi:hypothetical protein
MTKRKKTTWQLRLYEEWSVADQAERARLLEVHKDDIGLLSERDRERFLENLHDE